MPDGPRRNTAPRQAHRHPPRRGAGPRNACDSWSAGTVASPKADVPSLRISTGRRRARRCSFEGQYRSSAGAMFLLRVKSIDLGSRVTPPTKRDIVPRQDRHSSSEARHCSSTGSTFLIRGATLRLDKRGAGLQRRTGAAPSRSVVSRWRIVPPAGRDGRHCRGSDAAAMPASRIREAGSARPCDMPGTHGRRRNPRRGRNPAA